MAVGTPFLPATPMAAMWTGAAWVRHDPPTPAGASGASLSDISCLPSGWCMAVGSQGDLAGDGSALAEVWDGASWTQAAGLAGEPALVSVSCVSTSFCLAIGPSPAGVITERWDGAAWHPAGVGQGEASIVSCSSEAACMAVGRQDGPEPLALLWNGSGWSQAGIAGMPTGASDSVLTTVSCVSDGSCAAAGSFATPQSMFEPLLLTSGTGLG